MNPDLNRSLQAAYDLLNNGDIRESKKAFEQILDKDPGNIHALNLLAVICIKTDEFEQAVSWLDKALRLRSNDSQTYNNLGLAYKGLHNFKQAQLAFERSLQILPNQAQVLNNLGNVLAAQERHQQAANIFDNALRIEPNFPECLANFAQSLKELGQLDIAMKAIDHALQLVKDSSYYLNIKGELQLARLDYKAARKTFEIATRYNDYAPALINLSTALKQLGEHENAITCLKSVLEREPVNSEAHNHLGVLYEQLGEFDLAANCFKSAIKYTPNHASSYYQLSKLKNHSLTDKEIEKIKLLLLDEQTPSIFKVSLNFALAVHHDKSANHIQALAYYSKAQDLKAKRFEYKADLVEKYRKTIQATKINITGYLSPAKDNKSFKPIFIIGMPRSGTSLVEQILSSHSKVFGAGERGYINDIVAIAQTLTSAPYPKCMEMLSNDQAVKLGEEYKKRMLEAVGLHDYIIDKNPLNFNFVGFIKTVLPNALFIYCKRSAIDNCLSIFKLPFDDSQGYAHCMNGLGHYYREHEKLMSTWLARFPDDIITVHYEDVVNDLKNKCIEMLEFIGIQYEPSIEEFYNNKRAVMTPSAEQVRQPIYSSSVNTWQKYGDKIQPLIDSLQKNK